jgi:hypothetical protein
MLPRFKRPDQVIRNAGRDILVLGSDGNIDLLIPLWLEAGINFFWTLECAARMDPLALRRKYGKDIILGVGLDKRQFYDKASLKAEVITKVPQLTKAGPASPARTTSCHSTCPSRTFATT